MIFKKILSVAVSIIKFFIIFFFQIEITYSEETYNKYFANENGIVSIMYHRFDESKYPSTNIQMDIFKKHINIIKSSEYNFLNPIDFDKNFLKVKTDKEILITIDDGFSSFYEHAWPYLKSNKIPFILFISTESIGIFIFRRRKL